MKAYGLVGLVALTALAACGKEQPLEFQLAIEPGPSDPRLSPHSQEFTVGVEFGCNDDDATIDGFDVEYGASHVIVTFRGDVSYEAGDCADFQSREVTLDEPLGDRQLCDGSTDPATLVWPRPAGVPGDEPLRKRCR